VRDHLVPLTGDWALWRDVAVRSAGFPVGALDVFGAPDESAQLAEVAADPAFGEAVIWQNRSAYRTAVVKIAGRGTEPGSRRRQRDGVVAGYWQRYCAKNDTVGFFGPLAWGTVRDDGPAVAVRSRGLVASRAVHFESWCLEALVRAVDVPVVVPLNRRPEVEVRGQLEALGHVGGLRALERLEAARAAVASARGRDALLAALDGFDAVFEELTGVSPAPTEDGLEGGRTPLYLDCMRDLDVDLGPALVEELARGLTVLLEASRWWCGRSFAHATAIVAAARAEAGVGAEGPLGPLLAHAFPALWAELPPRLGAQVPELRDRVAALVEDPDETTIAARAAAAFADHGPAWPLSVFHSADIQIAARDLAAIEAGDHLAVVGDFHGGNNPLMQGLFSTRFADVGRFLAQLHADTGEPMLLPIPPRSASVRMSSRNMPDFAGPTDVQLAGPGLTPIHVGGPSRHIGDLVVRGEEVVDPAGGFRVPLHHLLFVPTFLSAMRTFAPFPDAGPRIAVGRTVLRRASWRARAADRPAEASGVAAWAAGLGVPHRAFCLPSGEAKPVYVDFRSPALARNLHRMLGRAAQADPAASVRLTEMLPGPDACWLDHHGARYTSEFRIVAVDNTRRGRAAITAA
jgi:hypothetical protein